MRFVKSGELSLNIPRLFLYLVIQANEPKSLPICFLKLLIAHKYQVAETVPAKKLQGNDANNLMKGELTIHQPNLATAVMLFINLPKLAVLSEDHSNQLITLLYCLISKFELNNLLKIDNHSLPSISS